MTEPLWTLNEIQAVLGLARTDVDGVISGVSIDSRTICHGDIFIALSGTPSGGFVSSFSSSGDGHEFLNAAEEGGAAAAIVSRPNASLAIPQLVVEDTLLNGLWTLGRAGRSRTNAKIIAVTGSAGKTSTKEFIAAGLHAYYSPGSYNNFWGLPLTLARLPKQTVVAVVEIGMNQPGEIARLSELARPDVGVVVNVGPVHLKDLGSIEAIRREKLSIVRGIKEGGTLVVPAELKINDLDWHGRVVRFGDGSEICAEKLNKNGERWKFIARVNGKQVEVALTPGGEHRVNNALAALAVASAVGYDGIKEFASRLGEVDPLQGRGVRTEVAGVTIIDDSFNANPLSVKASLLALADERAGRKIAILGDMLELGENAKNYHRELANHLKLVDGVICVGSLMKELADVLPASKLLGYFPSEADVDVKQVRELLRDGDIVVIKGSKKIFWVNRFVARLIESIRA